MATINKRSPKWYGWLPDLPDQRDFFYSVIAPMLVALLILVGLSCCQKQEPRPAPNQEESSPTATPASVNP